jgi:hypothetical protein
MPGNANDLPYQSVYDYPGDGDTGHAIQLLWPGENVADGTLVQALINGQVVAKGYIQTHHLRRERHLRAA